MKNIILYGLSGVKDNYRVVAYHILYEHDIVDVIRDISYCVRRMKLNPSVNTIYVMDQRRGLKRDYMDAVKANSLESWILFKDILEREAIIWPE